MQVKPQLDRVLCTACHACVSVCPKECITMAEDELGFLRPQIDEAACVGCGLCEKTCNAVKNIPACPGQKIYAARHKTEDVVKSSASGGVFTALSDAVLKMGGVIVGARYTERMAVEHVIARTAEERDALRGSKYTYSLCDKKSLCRRESCSKRGRLCCLPVRRVRLLRSRLFWEETTTTCLWWIFFATALRRQYCIGTL